VPFWEVKEENPSHPWWRCESEQEQGKNVAFVVREREREYTLEHQNQVRKGGEEELIFIQIYEM
jgi:hypothetical protein